jgi:hypothetical protein
MISQSKVDSFVQTWFQGLDEHIAVDHMLPLVADEKLEMVFPEQTLRSHADFRSWYDVVGESFTDQNHEIEEVIARPEAEGVALNVTVVWRAVQKSDGERLAMRARQSWMLVRSPETGDLRIVTYRVHSLDPV